MRVVGVVPGPDLPAATGVPDPTAVLERMCGPLCEAVLDWPGSAASLADLARSNLLLVPLDQRGQWYRYHHLFRDMLLAQLERQSPELIPVLRRRAAGWYVRNGMDEDALEYSMAAGDVDEAARLAQILWRQAERQRRAAALQRWFGWLEDRGGIEGRPVLAVQAAFVAEMTGRPAEAERWADVVDRWLYRDAARPCDPGRRGVGRRAPDYAMPPRGRADARRRRRGRARVR